MFSFDHFPCSAPFFILWLPQIFTVDIVLLLCIAWHIWQTATNKITSLATVLNARHDSQGALEETSCTEGLPSYKQRHCNVWLHVHYREIMRYFLSGVEMWVENCIIFSKSFSCKNPEKQPKALDGLFWFKIIRVGLWWTHQNSQ